MKYWAYINNEILGPYEKEKLFELPVFKISTLICPQTPVGEKTEDWKEASTYPEIAAMLGFEQTPADATLRLNSAPAQSKADPESPQQEPKIERSQPVFNTESPESMLKPITLHPIEQTPPAAAPHIEGADFEINQLNGGKSQHKPEEPQPSFTSANFDPMSLSQINRRAETPGLDLPHQEFAKPAEAGFNSQDIFSTPPSAAPAAPPAEPSAPETVTFSALCPPEAYETASAPALTAQTPSSAPEASPVTAFESRGQAAPGDNSSLAEIYAKLEAQERNSLTKQDIEPLRDKLSQLAEVLASIKGVQQQQQHEIMDKVQYLDKALTDIKASLAQAPAPAMIFTQAHTPVPSAAGRQPSIIENPSESLFTPQPAKEGSLTPSEPVKPQKAAKPEIVDQGSSGTASMIFGIIKKILKPIILLILLAALSGGAVFALKYFGIFDVTKFLPFPVPFLSAPQAVETPAPEPFQTGEAQAPQATQPAPSLQAAALKKDLSPEIIFIGRTFAAKAGGTTLENKIYEDAVTRKGDFNSTTWQVKELPNGMFELNAVIPLLDKTGQLIYSYEVDYAKKNVQPLDDASAKPLDAILKENKLPRQNKGQNNMGRQVNKAPALKGKQPKAAAKPAAKQGTKQIKGKTAAAADDEYEYVYEDEAGGTEE